MKIKVFNGAIASIILSGCSLNNPYIAPEVGDKANLRVITIPSNNTDVISSPQHQCSSRYGKVIAVLGPAANAVRDLGAGRKVGMPLVDKEHSSKQKTEVVIPANEQFSIEMWGVGISSILPTSVSYSWCGQHMTFTPIKGGNYEAVYNIAKSKTGKYCEIKLYEITPETQGEYKKTPLENESKAPNMCDGARLR
jgi:hypothetical protein